MEIQYIFLDSSADSKLKGMPNVVSITYTAETTKNLRHIRWRQYNGGRLIDDLISDARKEFWSIEVDKIFPGPKIADTKKRIDLALEIGPEKFSAPDLSNDRELLHDPITRALKEAAIKICSRKTAFLFPEYWSKEAMPFKDDLIKMMASGVWEFFRETNAEIEPPWTFLSLNQNSEIKSPLKAFVNFLHGQMLRDGGNIDVSIWGEKNGTILLSGPTGSGKSYAAKLLASLPKYGSKLVEVNLAAVGESLLESRMRGFKKNAFTGAMTDRLGWFEEADGGVLFLDEFQSTPPSFQVQLLDILSAVSDRVDIAKIGEDHIRNECSVKIIIAINEDIDLLLAQRRLRKDILYRIRHIESFPSLKDRLKKDIEYRYLRGLLTTYRWKSMRPININSYGKPDTINIDQIDILPTFFPSFTVEALVELANQEWEGNFRELERVAFDLFYECDFKNKPSLIDNQRVIKIIDSWFIQMPITAEDENKSALDDPQRKKLKDIQDALRKSKFVISKFLNGQYQPYYKSRPPLKKYLDMHKDALDFDVLSDSRFVSFMKKN